MRRLLVVTNIPTPYRVPLYNALAPALAGVGWELEVVFGSRGNPRRLWTIPESELRFPHHYLAAKNLRLGRERIINTYSGLTRHLARRRPDAVVCAGYGPGTVAASRYARRAGIPLALWSGAIDRGGERQWWRRLQRRWLVGRADRFLAYGTAARQYLERLGAPRDRIHVAWNTVDTAAFERLPGTRGPSPGEPLRLLSLGYLEPRKRIDLALDAVAHARAAGVDVELDIVGDGSARADLEARARARGLAGAVRFHGNRPYGELAALYGRAHLFVFPTSYDIWGLVLVEAMAAGRGCLASVRAGATRDLVADGTTGHAVDFEETARVAGRLAELARAPERIAALGRAARARVQERFTLAHSGQGWQEMVGRW